MPTASAIERKHDLIFKGKGTNDEMSTISAELTFNQLGAVVQRLPYEQKVALWRLLSTEVDRQDSLRRQARQEFAEAVRLIRSANQGVSEDEVAADVEAAVREVRAARRAAGSG